MAVLINRPFFTMGRYRSAARLIGTSLLSGQGSQSGSASATFNALVAASLTGVGTDAATSALDWPGNGSARRMLVWDLGGGGLAGYSAPLLPIYGPLNGAGPATLGITYLWQSMNFRKADATSGIDRDAGGNPRYFSDWFWGNSFDDGSNWQTHPSLPVNSNNIFQWATGDQALAYYGFHPYPYLGNQADGNQAYEVSAEQNDIVTDDNTGNPSIPRYGSWESHAAIVKRTGLNDFQHKFYYDCLSPGSFSKVITFNFTFSAWMLSGNPPQPVLTLGQSAWVTYTGNEETCGKKRRLAVALRELTTTEIAAYHACDTNAAVLSWAAANSVTLWYLNCNPTLANIVTTDFSGAGHVPRWIGSGRPSDVSYP